MNSIFQECKNVNEIKKTYRQACFKFHPDHGGNNDLMRTLTEAYLYALSMCNGEINIDESGKEHKYNYNKEQELALLNKLSELLTYKMAGVDILIVGKWLWIQGETKKYKEELKKCKCLWHSTRKLWYWREHQYKTSLSKKPFDMLCAIYGSKKFSANEEFALVKN